MPSLSRLRVSLIFLVLGASSCERRRVSVPVTPAPSQPASGPAAHASPAPRTPSPQPSASTPQTSAPQTALPETSAPEPTVAVPSSSATGSAAPQSIPYQVNKPASAAKKTSRSRAPATSPAAPSPAASAPAPGVPDTPTPTPKLGDVLTADEQKQYNASIDQSLAHAQTSLDQIKAHRLTPAQADEQEQIANFMKQAQTERATDLAGAKSLAERAEVLAKDLAATLH